MFFNASRAGGRKPGPAMRPPRRGLAVACLLMACAASSAPLRAQTTPAAEKTAQAIEVGQLLSGSLGAGETKTLRPHVPARHVVQGSFSGYGVQLDLRDAQGRHVRRLGRGHGGEQTFMWLTGDHVGSLALTSVNGAPGRYRLSLTQVLELAHEAAASAAVSGTAAGGPASDPAQDEAVLASPRLRALRDALARGGDTEAFWREMQTRGTPLVEPLREGMSLVTFLWRGAGDNVRLFGSPSGDHNPLARLEGSDVWWASFPMPDTARLSYRLAPDVPQIQGSKWDQRRVILATAQRDPLNPHVYPPGPASQLDLYQGSSVLELPRAAPQPWVRARADVPSGTLTRETLHSRLLGNERDVWRYVPAGAAPQALLVLFDADAYLDTVPSPTIIDNLIADKLIPPTAIVLVGNASAQARGEELPPNPDFAAFLGQELMPWVIRHGLAQPRERTVIAGSSYGGLASAYAGLVNARWFGNVLSLSGSYWWAPPDEAPGWMLRQYATAPQRDVRFYIDAGRYEAERGGRAGILETSRELGQLLRARGYTVTQVEHDTGHDYLHWQGSLGCGLVALLNPARMTAGLAPCRSDSASPD